MLQIKLMRIYKIIRRYIKRNTYILDDEHRKTQKNVVNLHYWNFSKGKKQNLGDYLSKIIVEYMLKLKDIDPNKVLKKTKHLYAIGSILHSGMADATIWGSGFYKEQEHTYLRQMFNKYFRKLDVRAVRGPKTRSELMMYGEVPEIYGDPAIILPLIYQPSHSNHVIRPYSVIKHFSDGTKCDNLINILTTDYESFVDEIIQSRKIISSSLHGIIIAEAYGIPAILYMPKCMEDQFFKFEDYYYGTGRFKFPIARSIEEAILANPAPVPDFENQRKQLMDVFPYDLWEE